MTESPLQRVCRHLADVWRLRRAILHDALARLPESSAAPRWLMRVRILNFLLARYADCTDLQAANPPCPNLFADDQTFGLEFGALPRNRDEIRAVLERIADCNVRTRGSLVSIEGHVLRLNLSQLIAQGQSGELPQDSHFLN